MIVITGAAGFIGSVLTRFLNSRGRKDLLLVDRIEKKNKKPNIEHAEYIEFIDRDDFINDAENNRLSSEIELVLHIGACTDTTEFNLDYLLRQNYEYSKKLCSWCINNNAGFIYASSAAVYGDGSAGFSDSDDLTPELKPLNPYGVSKWKFDDWLIKNRLTDSVTGLRFFNVFGPNEYHKDKMASVIFRSFPHVREKGVIKLFKSYREGIAHGEQKRDFIYVKDIVKVIGYFIDNPSISGIFNLGTGAARSFNDLAASMFSAVNRETKIEYIEMPEEIRDKYQYFTEADMTRLYSTGYKGKFSTLEESVSDYIRNYLLNETSAYY
ncbi:MAG: ADP-glyceromanno-heptose 6-epimerase [Oligoflexia bacterium]|nr:ADP-glyceromanno-heptose 6-epimerase [Oligoflexia bacterium]